MVGVTPSAPLIASAPVQPPLAVQEVAFVLDQVRVELPPEEMAVGLADSVTVGAAGFTVTVAVWVAAAPAAFVTVREYIVVTGGVTLTVCPLVTSMFPVAPPAAHARNSASEYLTEERPRARRVSRQRLNHGHQREAHRPPERSPHARP